MEEKRPLTIGLVSAYALISGGIQNHILGLKRSLEHLGHKVYLLAPRLNNEPPMDSHTFLVGKAVLLYGEGTSLAVGLWPEEGKRIKKILTTIPFDVLHFHSPTVSPTAWQIGAQADTAIVATFHEAREKHYPWYNILRLPATFLGHKVQCAIAISRACKQTVSEYFDTDFTIIPPGIDSSRFAPTGSVLPWFDDRCFTILYLSRLEHRKGIIELLSAYPSIKRFLPQTKLIIAGQGILEEEVRRIIRNQRLKDINLVGFVSEEEKPSYYRSCHLFCAPAAYGESFGIVILEAMASGRAIVAAANIGYQELLSGEKEGLLVPPRNKEALADAIIKLAKDRKRRLAMGKAGVKRAKKYDWKKITPRIVDVYQKAIAAYRSQKLRKSQSHLSFTFSQFWQQTVKVLGKGEW